MQDNIKPNKKKEDSSKDLSVKVAIRIRPLLPDELIKGNLR